MPGYDEANLLQKCPLETLQTCAIVLELRIHQEVCGLHL